MTKKIFSSPFFFFPLLSCIMLWPLTLGLFTLKNDALTYYYPVRMLISDALHNGELPLWTPFINMGYPLHADMQSGAWNPLVLLLGSQTMYSLAVFHLELLCYFSLAGIGFYLLCRNLGWSRFVCLLLGTAWQFSGFMTSSTQFFVCLAAAAWLPFVLLFLHRMVATGDWRDGLAAGLFMSLLFTGSYPALFILSCYFLLAWYLFSFFSAERKGAFIRKQLWPVSLAIFCFLVLSSPAILSFLRHLPFIDRGRQQSLAFVQQNSLPPLSLLSMTGPFTVTANHRWLMTDPLMRNLYIGIIPLIMLLYGAANGVFRRSRWALYWLCAALFFLLLSFGHFFILHKIAYYCLPLLNTFRHPALGRFFTLFGLLMAAGYCLHFAEKRKGFSGLRNWAGRWTFLLGVLTLLPCLFFFNALFHHFTTGKGLYAAATTLSLLQRFCIQMTWTIMLSLMLFAALRLRNKKTVLLAVMLLDLFVATQISLPISIIGNKSRETVEEHLLRNRERFPLPGNQSLAENSEGSIDSLHITGSMLPFSKKIGRNDYYITPGNLRAQEKFYESPVRETVFKNPVFFFADSGRSGASLHDSAIRIVPDSLSANGFGCRIKNPQAGMLVLQQNNYPGWHAYIDGNKTDILEIYSALMAIKTPPGEHRIAFHYEPEHIKALWYVSGIAWLLVLSILASGWLRRFLHK